MKRLVVLEVEVKSDDQLRLIGRVVGYGAWAVLGEQARPSVKIALTPEATLGLRSAWEALP